MRKLRSRICALVCVAACFGVAACNVNVDVSELPDVNVGISSPNGNGSSASSGLSGSSKEEDSFRDSSLSQDSGTDSSSSRDSGMDGSSSQDSSSSGNEEKDEPGTVIGQGVGDTVNILTGGYAEWAVGTESVFDKKEFAKLNRVKTTIGKQEQYSVYSNDLEEYLEELVTKTNKKFSSESSVNEIGVLKATQNVSVSVSSEYKKETREQTTSVFYDLKYNRESYRETLEGYANTDKLRNILSSSFLADADKVNKGDMSPETFIRRYGTHVVMSAIYGASCNIRYSVIGETEAVKTQFRLEEETVTQSKIEGTINNALGLSLGGGASTGFDNSWLGNTKSEKMETTFSATTQGGSAVNLGGQYENGTSAQLSEWVNSLNEEENNVFIDVPDGSLYCVWDLLGSEYANAKYKLNSYLYSQCNKQYNVLLAKVLDIYCDPSYFDEITGTLTVDFSSLLGDDDFEMTKDYVGENFTDNVYTIMPKRKQKAITKVVFKGGYYAENDNGEVKTGKLKDFSVKFDKNWKEDIVVEFENFGFEAAAGKVALDFCEVQSQNITINVVEKNYIKGGDGVNSDGFAGIGADGKNVVLTGTGSLEVFGGNGSDGENGGSGYSPGKAQDNRDGANGGSGSYGYNGYNGSNAIIAKAVDINLNGTILLCGGKGGNGGRGGNGGNGGKAGDCTVGNSDTGGKGGNGGNGGDGGNSGNVVTVVNALNIHMGNCIFVVCNGGNGGDGGNGGNGGRGAKNTIIWAGGGRGGNGGNGGSGGNAGLAGVVCNKEVNVLSDDVTIELNEGNNGMVGKGGNGGSAGSGGDGGYKGSSGPSGASGSKGEDGKILG